MSKKKTRTARQATFAEPAVPAVLPSSASSTGDRRSASAPASLMDTIEPDTTLNQLVLIVAGILAFPTVVSLAVKFLVFPMLAGR